ncbi:MAG TPA: GGDEF domain-containing protein, partial [Xanthomonadaceae bacterium]|nr:GGDEF domain-containing protein [Xanthomonadaceae bacterium]
FRNIPLAGQNAPADIRALALDAGGGLLAASSAGVLAERSGQLTLRHALPAGAYSLLQQPDGLWVGTRGGTRRYARGGETAQALADADADAGVTQLVRAQGVLWAGTTLGLFQFRDGRWQRFADPAPTARHPIDALYADGDGNLWVSQAEQLLRIVQGRIRERVIEGDRGLGVRVMAEDRERNLWLGSRWLGTVRLWNGWTRRYSTHEGLADPLAWSVARDPDGSLWVGTHDGVARLRDGRFEQVVGAAALPQADAYTLLAEPGRLWIGTRRGALLYEHGRAGTPDWMAPLKELQVNGIVRDRHSRLWFATSDGLHGWDGAHWQHYGTAEGLRDPRIRLLHEDRHGDLLLGTQAGLYALRQGRIVPLDGGNAALAEADITALHELPDGQLLAGTLAEQLWLLDRGRWSAFGEARGLPVNAPFFIDHDRRGQVWVAGMRGVYRTPLAGLIAAARDPQRQLQGEFVLNERGMRHGGIQGPCCNGAGNARGVADGGTFWLPSRDGLLALDTHDIRANPVVPLPIVERVRVRGQWHDAVDATPRTLDADARDLDFEFTVPSFQAPENVDLHYRLVGYDRDWRSVEDTRRRSATYTNLPAGNYTFEVTGSNNAGRWSKNPATFSFRIQPRFYETTWFRALLLGLAVVVVLGAHQLMLALHRRKRAALERLVLERTEALQSANLRLQEASFTDDLTQLRNRRYLSMHIPHDIAMYRRLLDSGDGENTGMVFLLVDVDHFKAINDNAGHHVGDAVLQQMAQLLLQQTRDSDYVVRWGGEEFLLVLRATPPSQLTTAAERLRSAIAAYRFDFGEGCREHLTCSLGAVEFPLLADPHERLGWEQLLVMADRALYWVKRNGRNGWAAYRPCAGASVDDILQALHEPSGDMGRHDSLVLVHSPPHGRQAAAPSS